MENSQNKMWGTVAIVVVIVLIIIGVVYAYNDHSQDSAMTTDQNGAQNSDVNGTDANNGASSNSNTKGSSAVNKNAPVITLLTPMEGKAGSEITISGVGFMPSNNIIKFAGFSINTVVSNDGNHVSFKVPESLKFCNGANGCATNAVPIDPGAYTVAVLNANGLSNVVSFTVTQGAVLNQ